MIYLIFVAVEKKKYILFKTTYPNIKISVLLEYSCIMFSVGKNSQSLKGFLKYLLKKELFAASLSQKHKKENIES